MKTVLLYLAIFFLTIFPYKDPDWGWHYRYGEYLLNNHQLLYKDIFSWTMAGYQWINPSWLYDPILYLIYSTGGFFALSVAGALITVLTFHFMLSRINLPMWLKGVFAVFFIWMTRVVSWQGLRSQMIPYLFYALLIGILMRDSQKKSVIVKLPLLFLLWANAHGSFTIGLVVCIGFLIGHGILRFLHKSDFSVKPLAIALIFSLCATLINPFGLHIYTEVFKHVDSKIVRSISEWNPIAYHPTCLACHFIGSYTAFVVIVFLLRHSLDDLPWILAIAPIFYLSLTARRFVPTLAVVSMTILGMFFQKYQWIKESNIGTWLFLFGTIGSIVFAIVILFPKYNLTLNSFEEYCKRMSSFSISCSEKLTTFIKANPPKGRGINFYGWGGYFIGRGVPMKLFIDGRMTVWEKNGYSAYREYEAIKNGDMEKFRSYDFDWIIFPKLNSVLYANFINLPGEDMKYWHILFEDNTSMYLVRNRL